MFRRDFHRYTTTSLLSGLLTTSSLLAQAATQSSTPAGDTPGDELAGPPSGPWRRLFLDGAVVETLRGLKKKFYQAEKHTDNPIIVADKPWEGKAAITGPYVYGTVLEQDGRLRMWYQVLSHGNHVGYAESSDGVRWTKPSLDVFTHNDQPTNFVVSALNRDKTGVECHNPSVVRLTNSADPARQFALFGFDPQVSGPRVAFSGDGIHWKFHNDTTEDGKLFGSSDVVNFGFDPYEERFYSTWKTRNRRGRAVGIAWSRDGLKWDKPFSGPVFVADDLDPDETQIYGMPVFPYQGLYVGLPWIYRARYFRYGEYSVNKLLEAQADSPRNMEVQLAWSWDQVNWTRPPEREQFIPRGGDAAWDRGMIVTARAPVVVGDKLFFYYGGTDQVHDDKRATAGIGLATLRLDGFCAMVHEGEGEGMFISRREPMTAPGVLVNARTKADGLIEAELLDHKNRVVPGFSRSECIGFSGDNVKHLLSWQTSAFSGKSVRPDYKIRFWLKNAELFSYLPANLDPNQPDLARFP